jgi:uncharacterized repeat protein (TIGR01451 family)
MRVDGPPRRQLLIRALIAASLAATPVLVSAAPAQAQTAQLGLNKSVSLNPRQIGPAQQFTYFLSYSCSSLTEPCRGARITDVLPPQLSRLATDVRFAGNFQSVSYNAANGTVTFVLFDPLPAGTTAQVSISAEFPAGTAPGTVASNIGTMTATNAPPVTSNRVDVTAIARSDWTVSKGLAPGTIPQLDTPFTYRVAFTLAAGGTQTINNVRFVDTLPPGAEFVSATDGGTFNAANNTVTWTAGNVVPNANADVTVTREVTVIFRSPPNTPGSNPNNVVQVFGAPQGQPDQLLGQGERAVTLRPAGNVTGGSKRAGSPDIGPGQNDTYTITASNPNATPLAGFQVTELLPPELAMVDDGQPNVTGDGPAPTITATPGGAVAVNGGGGGWSATVPVAARQIVFAFGTVPAAFSTQILLRAGIPANQPVVAGTTIENCVLIGGTDTPDRRSCSEQNVVPLAVNFSKVLTSSPVTSPGQTVSWEIGVGVPPTSASALVNPSITDCLPPGFDLVNPANPADPVNGTTNGFLTTPVITRTPGGCGLLQVLIRWSWTGAFTLPQGASGTFTLNTRVADGVSPSSQQNQTSLTASNLPAPLARVAPIAITSATLLVGNKEVKGDRDADFGGFPKIGNTTRGGTALYRATIRNVSDVAVTNLIVVDDFPIPGDIGVKDFSSRGSEWQPLFGDQINAPQAQSVSYSTQHNPCRPELTVNAPGCVAANWTTAPPSPLSLVGAIKVEYGSMVLNPGDSVSFTWLVNTPADAPVGAVAWNSFGYTATRVDNGSQLESAEPTKVGLQVEGGTAPPFRPPLPGTGANSTILALVGVLMLVGGLVLVHVARPPARLRTG